MQNPPALSELAAIVWDALPPSCAWCHGTIDLRDKTTILVAGGHGLHARCDAEFQSSGESAFGMCVSDGVVAA